VQTRFDIVIVGAGPAGLCLAAALASRLRVAVVDRQLSVTSPIPPSTGGKSL